MEGAKTGGRRRRGLPGLPDLTSRLSDDLGALAQNVRALPEAVDYLKRLAEAIEVIQQDTARMREATEHMDAEVVKLHEKFEAVEGSVGDLARALRPIRSRRRARAKEAANGEQDDQNGDDTPHALPTPEGS